MNSDGVNDYRELGSVTWLVIEQGPCGNQSTDPRCEDPDLKKNL